MKIAAVTMLVCAAVACGGSGESRFQPAHDMWIPQHHPLRSIVGRDFNCNSAYVSFVALENGGLCAWGCGQRAAYVQHCEDCEWKMDRSAPDCRFEDGNVPKD